jgi:hypothetical protein
VTATDPGRADGSGPVIAGRFADELLAALEAMRTWDADRRGRMESEIVSRGGP